jgi:hypothetical protein
MSCRARSPERTEVETWLSTPSPARQEYAERFWAKAIPEPNTGCWLWGGSIAPIGYGSARARGVTINAHRAAFLLAHGSLAPGIETAHRCDQRACVNPDHLFPATHKENLVDCSRKGRMNKPTGEKHWRHGQTGNTKFAEEQVLEMRARARLGESAASLARRFDCQRVTVRLVVRGVRWGHVAGAIPEFEQHTSTDARSNNGG